MRRVLEVPSLGASIGIEGDQTVGVQVVALTHIAVPVGPRISRTPEDSVALRIVGAGAPRGRAASFPAIAVPGFVPRFALGGNGVEAPQPLARLGVVTVDESPSTILASRH